MKGSELYMVTDLQGRPLFFITEPNEIDFRPIISRSAAILCDLGIERPVLVFDRGGRLPASSDHARGSTAVDAACRAGVDLAAFAAVSGSRRSVRGPTEAISIDRLLQSNHRGCRERAPAP